MNYICTGCGLVYDKEELKERYYYKYKGPVCYSCLHQIVPMESAVET